MDTPPLSYRQHRYPAEIIAPWVRLYCRFPLSYGGLEELLCERGIIVSYEAIRGWCLTFGPHIAAGLRRRRPQTTDTWPLDEMHITMKGKTSYLWRAVDADGMVLDILMHERRNQEATAIVLRRVVERSAQAPRVAVTDKLASYAKAIKTVLPRTEHWKHKGLNKRAEPSHQPTRHRDRAMRRFTSPAQAQRLLAPCGPIREHVCPRRPRLSAAEYRATLVCRFVVWRKVAGVAA